MNFHKVTMDLSRTDFDLYDVDKTEISTYMLPLPELDKSKFIHHQIYSSYYLLDLEWNEIYSNMKFVKPRAPYCNY